MSETRFDPAEFKATQRAAWGEAASGWRKWWRVFEAAAQPLNERIVDLAGVKAGHAVLDVATGIGEPALTAAKRTGPKGSVVASDFAAGMLEVGRERAKELGLSNVKFVEADAETLAVEAGPFDAATCRWALMLMPDPRAACAGVRKALKPGARFAAAVWAEAENVPFIAIPQSIAAREGNFPPPPPGSPGPFVLGAPGALEKVFAGAGFEDVRAETFRVTFSYASSREFMGFISDVSGSMRKTLAEAPAEVRERVRSAIERETARLAAKDGSLRLENLVRCVSGKK
jgi:SAM-dependent methyltransferase